MRSLTKRILSLLCAVCILTSGVGDVGLLAQAARETIRLTKTLEATDGGRRGGAAGNARERRDRRV